jgi:hypothetical protein
MATIIETYELRLNGKIDAKKFRAAEVIRAEGWFSRLSSRQQLDGFDEHERPVFAHGEIHVDRTDNGTTDLHPQNLQSIQRLTERIRAAITPEKSS